MENRPLCECGKKCAINYKKDNKYYYRKVCNYCLKRSKKVQEEWETIGYQKKKKCEKCNFDIKYDGQCIVIKVPGVIRNFKTICLNCKIELDNTGGWQSGDLIADF